MPLNVIQQQFGQNNIEQTMRYAQFHPDYVDVKGYYDTGAGKWGVEAVVYSACEEDTVT